MKAKACRDLPTIRQLKLRLAPDEYIAASCLFYAAALTASMRSSVKPPSPVWTCEFRQP